VQYATDINSKLTGIIVRIYVHPYKLRHVIAVRFLFTIFNYYLKKNCVVLSTNSIFDVYRLLSIF